jgi:hypothetical protein
MHGDPNQLAALPFQVAMEAVKALQGWIPPEGVGYAVSTSTRPSEPTSHIVNVVLWVDIESHHIVNLSGVPGAAEFAALTEFAQRILDEAWDQPACASVSPYGPDVDPATIAVAMPDGPLDLS